jgi:hypothetical protein
MHVLPQLRKLERKWARELVVIGVHSAKFPGEKSTEAVRHAVERLAVGHPVVNDVDFRVWQEYACRAWPTLMFIDPAGRVIGRHEGEFPLEGLDQAIGQMVAEFDAAGLLDRRPLSFTAERENAPDRPLLFPGKQLADPPGGRLFVADTGHHRVLEVGLEDGRILRAFGSGEPGMADGSAETASFNAPQGLALAGDTLFVCDTENHAVRRIDLGNGQISLVAGTGEQARVFNQGGPARLTALNSPGDVVALGERLLVAMAGFHQVWELNLRSDQAVPWAGSGREDIEDGPLAHAKLAQPSGLALNETAGLLYVADSEVSGIRAIDLGPDGQVRTIVGEGLFDFGDVDGVGPKVRLQHPLGLSFDPSAGLLYVADSYNHKIKRLEPTTAAVTSWLGSGLPGHRDGQGAEAQFSEPGGLSLGDGRLFIADTNNHAVRVCELTSGEVSTLVVG